MALRMSRSGTTHDYRRKRPSALPGKTEKADEAHNTQNEARVKRRSNGPPKVKSQ